MKRKVAGSYAHPMYPWIVETIRGGGDVRSVVCGRCNVVAVVYRSQRGLKHRERFVKAHSKCKEVRKK